MQIKNEAKWESLKDSSAHEIRQLAIRYYIKHPNIDNECESFQVDLFYSSENGEEKKANILIKNDLGNFLVSKETKLSAINDMKNLGKQMFDKSFQRFYGNFG